jgi:hypothetical protein
MMKKLWKRKRKSVNEWLVRSFGERKSLLRII